MEISDNDYVYIGSRPPMTFTRIFRERLALRLAPWLWLMQPHPFTLEDGKRYVAIDGKVYVEMKP